MKKHLLFFLLILLNLHPVKSQDKNNVPGELLVMLNPAASPYKMQSDLSVLKDKNTRLNITRTLSASMHIYLMTFDHLSIHEDLMLNAVRSYPGVQIAQFNHYVNERNTVPNDPQFGVMWGMENTGTNGGAGAVADADIDATTAWDVTTGGLTSAGDTIVVAVIDGGFSLTHPDLIDNYWRNYDEIPDNGVDDDLNGYIDDFNGWHSSSNSDNFPSQSHGTHVAGTIGAKGNNGIGVTGVNWNVKIMPISYGSGSGSFESNVVEAYAFARDQRREYDLSNGTKGAFVVATNSSFGVDLASPSSYPLWCAMYDSLGVLGILSAGATANANYDVDAQGDIPTACPSDWLITVTNKCRFRSFDDRPGRTGNQYYIHLLQYEQRVKQL
jgi:subtilisin family serine protease